jgi:hypothetical protein
MSSKNDADKREQNQRYEKDVRSLTEEVSVKRNLEVENREFR